MELISFLILNRSSSSRLWGEDTSKHLSNIINIELKGQAISHNWSLIIWAGSPVNLRFSEKYAHGHLLFAT